VLHAQRSSVLWDMTAQFSIVGHDAAQFILWENEAVQFSAET
jgi:hypothetical protein